MSEDKADFSSGKFSSLHVPQPILSRNNHSEIEFSKDRLLPYYAAQAARLPLYEGQLKANFQQDLALYHSKVTPEDCDFYHCVDLPDGQLHAGPWDLRQHESRYLGGNILGGNYFYGKRVAEFGPATGALTAHLSMTAGEVVVFDLPFGAAPELVPFPQIDMVEAQRSGAHSMNRLRNSWWYVKTHLGYAAKAVYTDIYNLPPDIGRFDVAMFGALLLHLSNPFRALQQAAALVDDTIIVTEIDSVPSMPGLQCDTPEHPAIAVFNDGPSPSGIVHWWSFGPRAIMKMFERLGFEDIRVDTHVPPGMLGKTNLFTVVGRRKRASQVLMAPPASSAVPLPPAEARFLVSGTDKISEFVHLGQQGFEALSRSLKKAGIDMEAIGSVLDFGCGVGRVLRYWADFPGIDVHGTDYQPEAIEWCERNIPFATFAINTLEPKLKYEDDKFNLIYCLSVFTHLPEAMQAKWFAELIRILKPGGLIYFTTHGDFYTYLLDAEGQKAFAEGELLVTGGDQPGTNICAAFHPVDFVFQSFVMAHGLTLIEHVPCGAKGNPNQDSYLVRKNFRVTSRSA